ncbi:MarR family winged helix-turn-helix transcriptional regulator [Corynebacterium amycolatum]|uniref:MarR family winged helix-turn-helix transcriptional regulator n=1 Tax=Corynebacterium TaxID=1716 RepID=UPI00066578BA|nr:MULTISPECIES: MarR family winged helix-turn-helix transcriptional regulator [Corynebacterium]ASE57654.1 MarR family transcriptional regulator [Corynebacterium jeikeium]MBC6748687.1 MarR family transcriptional regulator [Corynebacterium sp. LK25]MBC6793555.1 MarR family transcriptional regulator [Corynebacterium sp. LK26]MBC6830765.1 MarR family transcriptional regulator [Corynebacterium sp. LK32]AYX82789.1 MarR family transcriptional regulator [Corynebacterium jeikeium]
MRNDDLAALVYENMLLSRVSSSGYRPHRKDILLDRSAAALLARLEAQPDMTVAELSDALGLDISTVHRQLAAAMRQGYIAKRSAPSSSAKVHSATDKGLELLHREIEARKNTVDDITHGWEDSELAEFVRLMRKFNEGVEEMRGHPWPR